MVEPWQTIGIIVGIISGLSGVGLGFYNLYLRRRDLQPQLKLEADFGGENRSFYGGQAKGFLFLDITNSSPMAETTLTRVYLELRSDDGHVEDYHLPLKVMWTGGLELPKRLKVRGIATVRIDLLTLSRQLYKKGYRESVLVSPRAKDALGNIYKAPGETMIPTSGPGGVSVPTTPIT